MFPEAYIRNYINDWGTPGENVQQGGGLTFVNNEVPSGAVDGSNVTFVAANVPSTTSQRVYKNGQRLEPGVGNDYTISGAVITMTVAPQVGDLILIDYMY